MPLTFYPYSEDAQRGSFEDRIALFMDAAERYKAIVLDVKTATPDPKPQTKRTTPKDLAVSYNWEEIAIILREIRALPEATKNDKLNKANLLMKLSEVYEVLRGAKMPKLETVRLSLTNEAEHLRTSAGGV